MKTASIETAKISIPQERIRQEPGNIEDLRQSIAQVGQLQPIGVTPDNVLVWGYRRWLAIHEDPTRSKEERTIWYAVFKGNPDDCESAHRAENACQHVLDWKDRARKGRMEVERRVLAAEAAGGRRGVEREGAGRPRKDVEEIDASVASVSVVTSEAVADSLGVHRGDFAQDLLLADSLWPELMPDRYRKDRVKAHPELKLSMKQKKTLLAQTSRNNAIAKLKEMRRANDRAAKIAEAEKDGIESKEEIPLICGNCFEWFSTARPKSVDLVVTDPPFAISQEGAQTFKDGSPASAQFGVWDAHSREEEEALLSNLFVGIAKVLVDGGSWYVFMARDYLGIADRLAESAGLKPRTTIAWVKPNPAPNIRGGFANAWEAILYGQKGTNPIWTPSKEEKRSEKNWIERSAPRNDRIHSTEKPVELLQWFIELSSNAGAVVLDPFAGSGATCIAAIKAGRTWIGIEKDQGTWLLALKRIQEEIANDG